MPVRPVIFVRISRNGASVWLVGHTQRIIHVTGCSLPASLELRQERATHLLAQGNGGEPDSESVTEAAAELVGVVEELRVAHEEMRTQAEELADAADRAESERRRFAELFLSAPLALMSTDANGVIGEANNEAQRLTGRGRASLLDKPMIVCIHDSARAEFRAQLSVVAASGEARTWVSPLATRDGQLTPCLVIAAPEGAGEWCKAIRWVFQDLADLVRARASLRTGGSPAWLRLAERTASLREEVERLRLEVAALRARAGPAADAP